MINKFQYHGNYITFQNENDDVMVNATEMAKPFGKLVAHWFENPGTFEYIAALADSKGIQPLSEKPITLNTKQLAKQYPSLIKVVQGGNIAVMPQGTWFHEDIALEFARWLSPEFSIWCNNRIKELLKHGFTATPDKLNELVNNPDLLIDLATALKKERAEKELVNRQLQLANQRVEVQEEVMKKVRPKIEYHDKVLASTSLITTTEIAKSLGTNAQNLNKMLNKWGVMFNLRGTWLPYGRYENMGLGKITVTPYYDHNNELKTNRLWKWTEKGRKFIIELWSAYFD